MRISFGARLVVLLATAVWGSAAPAGIDRRAEIQKEIKARVDGGKNAGIVVGTIEPDGGSVVAGYGEPGAGALPLDGNSVFEIGSITKVFTVALLGDMVNRGEVALDDPVQKYLPPGVAVPQRNGRQITLVDLATHTSGLPRLPTNMQPRDPMNPYADYTAERLYSFLNGAQLTRDVGSTHEYSNLGVGLLGHALVRRGGKSYEALVTERILKPLGMVHTAVTLTPWMQAHLALGHDAAGNVVPNWDIGVLEGAGALRSTANDMLRFARANLDPSQNRLARILRDTHQVRAPTGRSDMSMALGWLVRQVDGHAIVWHNGGTGGYRTWIGFDETRRIAAVVLTNSSQGADDLGYLLLRYPRVRRGSDEGQTRVRRGSDEGQTRVRRGSDACAEYSTSWRPGCGCAATGV
jgi:serine-type D-Ala-D-Ala carboxypeptidase/endopeptidase